MGRGRRGARRAARQGLRGVMRRQRSSSAATRAQTRAYAERVGDLAAQLRGEMDLPSPRGTSLRSRGPLPPGLVMLMGFPGVGKSHCARLLCRRLGAAHLASDHLRGRMFIAASYADEENATVFRAVDALLDGLLGDGHLVVLDATNLRRRNREAATALARRRGVPMVHVLVSSSDHEVRARLAARVVARAAGDHSDADQRVYDAMRQRGFEPPDDPYEEIRNGPGIAGEIERVASTIEARIAAAWR